MSGFTSLIKKVKSRKMRVFLLFLVCSFFAWSISKLSETYESRANFKLVYENIPDTLLSKGGVKSISAKLRTSGFQFLNYAISPKTIRLNVQNILEQDGDYFLTVNSVKSQIENQLPNRVSLVDIDVPIYYTDLYLVDSKKVPIKPKLELRLVQNHLLQGKLGLEPDSVTLKGPEKDILNITSVATLPLVLNDVSMDFSQKIQLQSLDSLNNVVTDLKETTISGKVVRFSEKEYELSINSRNVPENYRLRTFPDKIKLLCKAGVDRLKEIKASDFEVSVDYNSISGENYLFVELTKEPNEVFSVRLLDNRVEFVLEKI